MNRSIDEYMAQDQEYRDETDAIIKRHEERLAAAKTDEEREQLRKQMCLAFNQASYARYDRAKAQVRRDVRQK
jgi:hypothetical protein